MNLWVFKGYIDENGTNVFDEWYSELPAKAQAKLDWIIDLFLPRKHNEWIAKFFKKMHGYDNLFEVRFESQDIVYRPLGSFAPKRGDFTFLIGATKKRNDVLIPKDAEEIALKRLDIILNDPERAKDCEFTT
jgi:Phage derived protein Gp49-like (DUF891)